MEVSLFFFADDGERTGRESYRLLMDAARFADAHDFTAVWTPERHFHRFGGLYPNPSVTAAAVAAVTTRVGVRAGSVVVPLHHPLRVAEEWAVVDNLSGGRAGISLASGWNRGDFALRPETFEDRRRITVDSIDVLRSLWRGETGPDGHRIFPRPVQEELPLWLSATRDVETFAAAGRAGAGVLTHLLAQSPDELRDKIAVYRRCFRESGRQGNGHVTLMIHTYLADSAAAARAEAEEPLRRYLASALSLNVGKSGSTREVSGARQRLLLDLAVTRYFERDGLFGTVACAEPVVRRLAADGVDEIGCLIDFGVPVDAALRGLEHLDELRKVVNR